MGKVGKKSCRPKARIAIDGIASFFDYISIKRSPVVSMASRNESEDPAMPLKLKWRKKKVKEGDGDSASIASGASYRSQEGRQGQLATDGAYRTVLLG